MKKFFFKFEFLFLREKKTLKKIIFLFWVSKYFMGKRDQNEPYIIMKNE